jgi:hypothetical protein
MNIKISVFTLMLGFISAWGWATPAEFKITPQWAEKYVKSKQPQLLKGGNKDEVRSFFYFGRSISGITVVGMERIGANYEAHRWLLLFEKKKMIGWYQDLPEFPLTIQENTLFFPKNARYLKNLDLSNMLNIDDVYHAVGRYPFRAIN